MSSIQSRRGIGGAVLVFSLLIGVGLAASATAQGQYPYGRDRNGYNDASQIAQAQGYRDGIEQGAEHARKNHRYDLEGTHNYKDATSGYRSSYGSKDAYKQAYRDGFRRGYDESFRQYGANAGYGNGRGSNDPYYRNNDPYYRNGGYGQNDIYRIAQDQGYRDGVDQGADHARNGKHYDPEGTHQYKNATTGYRSEYGNKDAYKQAYRDSFRRGYDEGYRRSNVNNGRRNSRSRTADILGGIFGRP